MNRKTPQEKKRLSYAKDRRDTYGDNAKSSRKNVPRAKRRLNRIDRRRARQAMLAAPGEAAELPADQMEGEMKHRPSRGSFWKKVPATPLGEAVRRKLARRVKLGMIEAPAKEGRTG